MYHTEKVVVTLRLLPTANESPRLERTVETNKKEPNLVCYLLKSSPSRRSLSFEDFIISEFVLSSIKDTVHQVSTKRIPTILLLYPRPWTRN